MKVLLCITVGILSANGEHWFQVMLVVISEVIIVVIMKSMTLPGFLPFKVRCEHGIRFSNLKGFLIARDLCGCF